MPKLIAIIDDEQDILDLVSLHLQKAGFETLTFADPIDFFDHFRTVRPPDLLVLDLMLPNMDGFDVCKAMRSDEKLKRVFILMLSARSEEIDRVLGLELGADDYLTKPFSAKELVARVKAMLRRQVSDSLPDSRTIWIKELIAVDSDKFEARMEGRKLDLTTTEFKILELLASHQGRLYSRQQILDYLWGNDKAVLDRTVDVHVKNLRDKIGPAATLIKNIRGMGYKLEA